MTGSVGKVYSEALFELAVGQNISDSVFNELSMLDRLWRDNPELPKLLSAPTISAEQKHDVLINCFEGKISDLVLKFLFVITEKKRAGFMHEICEAYKAKQYELKNIAEVTVTTSIPLNDTLRSKLIDKLQKTYGKTIILHENVDESIMGGAVVKYGGTLLDGSVRNELANIGKRLKGTIA